MLKSMWKILRNKASVAVPLNSLEKYVNVLQDYRTAPNEVNEAELQSLIGTITPIDEVLNAVDAEFDSAFYLAVNPDVRRSGLDPVHHYLLWGWKENRTPSRFFDPAFYVSNHKDLSAKMFPLAHYLKAKNEGALGNRISDSLWFEPFNPDDAMWRTVQPAVRTNDTRAVVVIPVYKGLEETLTAVYSALQARGKDQYSLLVVNDCSPDELLSEKLRELAAEGLFDFYDSETNRGFVKTINYAIENLTHDLDVVLLNSDAYVSAGWFGRLIAHADKDEKVATITPMSNNATICSYPLYDKDNFLSLEVSPQELDLLAMEANRGLSVETPTGVGFCFYMRRSVIREIGALDEKAFLLGYGEENDFCMRALGAGYKNIIAGDVFVFHTGSVSFSASKEENFNRGQTNLALKHPNYEFLVRGHVEVDPERHLRRNLDAQRVIKQFSGAVVVVTHKWAGGIETYLKQLNSRFAAEGRKVLVLRVHDGHHVTIEDPQNGRALFIPNLTGLDLRTEWNFFVGFLNALKPEMLHINSFAGLNWGQHSRLLCFFKELALKIVFVGHDYAPISCNYQLLRPDMIYDGTPDVEKLRFWSNMKGKDLGPDLCDPEERLSAYRSFFGSSNVTVEVPSVAAKEIYGTFFPDLQISIKPHEDHLPEVNPAKREAGTHARRVAVVGAIGPHKGSGILGALALDAQARNLNIEYHLIGYSNDDNLMRSKGVVIHGAYASELDALAMLDKIKPDVVFIPSIWSETFCYTLSLALKKRIPTVVFDLGAQAERLAQVKWGVVFPLDLMRNTCKLSEALLDLPLEALWNEASLDRELS
ncbi:glycosyltransferase [Allorhizobium sp. BGMRC 0089]|uniref:glycosyltransferase n=1 Tax=Allorhizobium sonneratiae TaxID=2934936 RepID=UPI002033C932|nr:glycosyltransferase [Allorhizobium sonneratiae]MCM2292768.1 glycosyltransferase [Allorhizobium sonneratiae]